MICPHLLDEETEIKRFMMLPKVKLLVSAQLVNRTQTAWLQHEAPETVPGDNLHQVRLEPSLTSVSNAASTARVRAEQIRPRAWKRDVLLGWAHCSNRSQLLWSPGMAGNV